MRGLLGNAHDYQTNRHPIAPVSLKLDNSERQRLPALAVARKRSSHYLMREAVREYSAEKKPGNRSGWRQAKPGATTRNQIRM